MSKSNYKPIEVRHQNTFQGYYVVDKSNGFSFKQDKDLEPELFKTKEKAQETADELNKN